MRRRRDAGQGAVDGARGARAVCPLLTVPGGQRPLGAGHRIRRRIGWQRIVAVARHALAVELALAARRGEVAFGERQIGLRQVEAHEPLLQQGIPRHRFVERMTLRRDKVSQDRFVVFVEGVVGIAHRLRQPAEDGAVGTRLRHRRDRRPVQRQEVMAVHALQVPVLGLRRRRQQVIGVVGGVGLEMLEHDSEEVFARQPGLDRGLVRRDCGRVAVVNDQRLHRRTGRRGRRFPVHRPRRVVGRGQPRSVQAEGVAEAVHVDRARDAALLQVGPLQAGRLQLAQLPARAELDAAAALAPRPDQRRQTGDVAHRHAAAVMALHAVVDADRGRPRRRVFARQPADAFGRDAGDLGGPLRGPLLHPLRQLLEADGVGRNVVAVVQPGVDDFVHHRQRERAVGPRSEREPLVGRAGGARTRRVDNDDAPALFARGLDEGPQVQVARQRVAAPDQDQPRVREVLRLNADGRADRVKVALEAGLRADRARQSAGAHLLEEAVRHAMLLQPAHRAGVGVGQHRLRAPGVDYLPQPRRDPGQRLVPRDALKAAAALRPYAALRMAQPIGVIDPLEVAVDLAAEGALRHGMVGVAPDVERAPVGAVDCDLPAAGVRAVVRAGAGYDADGGVVAEAVGVGHLDGLEFAVFDSWQESAPGESGSGGNVDQCRLQRGRIISHTGSSRRAYGRTIQPVVRFSQNRYFRATSLDPGLPSCYIQGKVGPSTIQGRTKSSTAWSPPMKRVIIQPRLFSRRSSPSPSLPRTNSPSSVSPRG